MSLLCNTNVVKTPRPSAQGLLYRVKAVQNVHLCSLPLATAALALPPLRLSSGWRFFMRIRHKAKKNNRNQPFCVLLDMPNVSRNGMSAASLALAEQSKAENYLIAQGLKRQDADLLDELIVRYQHRLLRYLLYLTGNREVAEDLFQETWMRVLLRGAQYNGNARFDTWLFTIARNLLIDLRRKRTMASLDEMCETSEDERPFEVASDEPNPFEQYQSREDAKHVATALLTLDPLHREVLVLRFHEELALDEIASVTRAPLSTVKSRLYRGLAALKPRVMAANGVPAAVAGARVTGLRQHKGAL
jgi:RNA polymerase sigma-70 factor (ECF subfamily)